MATKKMSDEDLGELKTSNTVIRGIIGAKLAITDLKADFDNGTLVLRGTALSQAVRQNAVDIARRTPGVKHVDDRMEIGSGAAATGAAAPGGAPTGGAGARTYTVKKGDTLSEIAQRELGAASRWKEIFEANRGTLNDPDRIMPGQVLTLPKT